VTLAPSVTADDSPARTPYQEALVFLAPFATAWVILAIALSV